MFAIHPRFTAVILHPTYALGLFGFFAAVFPLSLGRMPTLVVGELFLLPWTVGFLALWWHLSKQSGARTHITSPGRKLATGVGIGLSSIIVASLFFYLGRLVGLPIVALATLVGIVVAAQRLATQRKSGTWWPTTSTGVWVGIIAGSYAMIVLIASAAPNLG
jgi:hypothetical protein